MNEFWSGFYKSSLSREPIVGRIHLIEQLESLSPYRRAKGDTYFQRVKRALNALPAEHHEAALLVFSSVMYFPAPILDDMWRFLWFELTRTAGDADQSMQFFEVDPAGMISQFSHLNGIEGRLDLDTHARVDSIQAFVQAIRQLEHSDSFVRQHAADEIRLLASKEYWVLLSDKALSGQSLAADLKRYLQIARVLNKRPGSNIRIVVLVQILTTAARHRCIEDCDLEPQDQVLIFGGCELDQLCQLNSPQCAFATPEHLQEIDKLCRWFAEHYVARDNRLNGRMFEKSGDNLAFGYRGCGLTISDHDNCPTASVPLLWYESGPSHPLGANGYVGPYPRTHSRVGQQSRLALQSDLASIPNWPDKLLGL